MIKEKWDHLESKDPVKARMLLVAGVVGIPALIFLACWLRYGFCDTVIGTILLSIVLGLLAGVFAIVNLICGSVASYIFFGDFDNGRCDTCLEVYKRYQDKRKKER